ncbi:MAG: NUDIX domain-containing protein [Pseudomonadota bacterium]
MGFDDQYRLGAHAVITNDRGEVLMLKATYGAMGWGLPGGAMDRGETIHECVRRECMEELGLEVQVGHLTGVYYINAYNSQCFIFRCTLPAGEIRLSSEHSAYRYFPLAELGADQRRRVEDCLRYVGVVFSQKF